MRWSRWAALFFVFACEYYAIGCSVDAQLVANARGGLWSALINFELIARAAFLCATSALVLMRPTRIRVRPLEARTERALCCAHALVFVGFWWLTRVMFESETPPPGPALLWLAAWGALGVASAVSLCIGSIGVPEVRPSALFGAFGVGLSLAWVMNELGAWTQELWHPFSAAALAMAAFWLRLCFTGVETDPAQHVLALDGFAVHVEAGCSGLESLGMVTLLTLCYLAIFRRELRFPRAFALLPLGLTLVWLGNGVRLAIMIWIGARISPGLALGGFHSKAGWVLFSGIALGLAYVGHHSPWFAKKREIAGAQDDRELTTAFLLPLMVLLAVALISGMLGRSDGGGYGLRMASGVLTLALLWSKYGDLRWREPGALAACLLGLGLGLVWLGSGWPFPAADAGDARGFWLFVRALGFSTVVPLAEELAFRGYLLRVLQNRRFERVSYRSGPWWAVAISSLVFGALHDRWLAGTVAGLVYALIQIRGGRLRDAVLAHASTNATLAVFALALQNPSIFG
ncbi:MAG TPA: exosortase E/protease, VPEID-CTERM system [Polyangiaceae bacterium]|nr:exosortase E/protease, VPEID-CTERM system [Polyangiaceae bacterium]